MRMTARTRLSMLTTAAIAAGAAAAVIGAPASASGARVSASAQSGTANNITNIAAQQLTTQVRAIGNALMQGRARGSDVAPSLDSLSESRRAALLDLAHSDPQALAGLLLPDNELRALNSVAGSAVEKRVMLRGTYTLWHRDNANGQSAVTAQVVTSSGPVDLVYTGGQAPSIHPGTPVSVSAYQLDNQTAVAYAAGGTNTSTSTGSTGSTTPLGQLNVAVIVGNFSNSTTSLDPNVARTAFTGSPGSDVDSWYASASYGKSSLNPSFFGPYTIADTTTSGSCPSMSTAANHLMSAATHDLTYSQFQRIVLVLNCSGYGASTNIGQTQVGTPQGTITGDLIEMDSSFLGDKYGYVHELAHNLGNMHAAFYVCDPSAFVAPTRFGENCNSSEYGNEFDALGATIKSPRATPFLDPYHANNAGWFGNGNYVSVTAPGTYTYKLLPYETAATGALALNIPRGSSGTAFTLEYRQPVSFDSWMASSDTSYCGGQCTATQGPMIQFVDQQSGTGGGSDTQAIDTTPNSIQSSSYYSVSDNRDGALLPGKTFTDPEYGISITTQSADATGATIKVTVPSAAACTRAAPSVKLVSPATQSTTPGQSLSYTVTVTDNDSSACPADEFKYLGGKLDGYTSAGTRGTFTATGAPDVFSLSPGGSTNVTVSLSPDATVVDGAYTFQSSPAGGIGTISANALGTPNVSMPNVTVQQTSPADSSAPSVPAGLNAQALGSSSVSLDWSPATDNQGVAGYQVLVDNSSLYYAASPQFTFYSGLTPAMSHTFSVQAFDYAGNLSAAATATATTASRTDTTAPVAVGGVSATATDRSVTVSWKPTTDNVGVIGYLVSPFAMWVPAGSTSLTVTGLATNTPYDVKVQAEDGSGNPSSSSANTTTVTTAYAGSVAPTQPSLLYSPTATVTGGIRLSWNASTDPAGIAGYYVYRNGRRMATVTSTSYTDPASDLYPNAGYSYDVEAFDSAGNISAPTPVLSTISPTASTTDTTAPSAASVTSPTTGSTVSGTVTLTASASDNTGVARVQYYVDGSLLGQSATSPFSFSWNTGATYAGTHVLYARAFDAAGNYSTMSVTTVSVGNGSPADTTAPTVPTNLTATAISATQVNLSWAASTDNALAGYYVYRNNTRVATITGTSWSDSSVVASTTYSYYVSAYDTSGNVSSPSNTVSVATPASASAPPATTGSVSGTVTSGATGSPLANVKVTVTVNGAKQTYSSDASGHYTVPNLVPGTYTFAYSLKTYKSTQATASVTAGQATTLNVSM